MGGVHGEVCIMRPGVKDDPLYHTRHIACFLFCPSNLNASVRHPGALRRTQSCHLYKCGQENATRNAGFDYLFLEKLVGIARARFCHYFTSPIWHLSDSRRMYIFQENKVFSENSSLKSMSRNLIEPWAGGEGNKRE